MRFGIGTYWYIGNVHDISYIPGGKRRTFSFFFIYFFYFNRNVMVSLDYLR